MSIIDSRSNFYFVNYAAMNWSLFGSALCAAVLVAAESSATSYPQSPPAPTSAECTELHRAFYRDYLSPINSQIMECLKGEPRFGWVVNCKGTGKHLTAWAQCHQLDCAHHEAWEEMSRQVSLCRQRAAHLEASKSKIADHIDEIRKTANRFSQIKEKFEAAKSFADNPRDFLIRAFTTSIVQKLFPSNMTSGPELNAAQDIYRYGIGVARYGQEHAARFSSPVVDAIQRSAMETLDRQFRGSLETLTLVEAEMARFGVEPNRTTFEFAISH